MGRIINPPAIVREAEDSLEALAERVGGRETQHRRRSLQHVKEQAADVLSARQRCGRGEWGPWCEKAGLSGVQAWRYAEFGNLSYTKGFSSLTEDEQWAAWQRISGNDPKGETEKPKGPAIPDEEQKPLPIVEDDIKTGEKSPPADESATNADVPHVARNTGNNEWYTPPEYLDAARQVLGAIDLDPATSEIAQARVRAAAYYTAETDGLAHPWAGRVWMNPPYAADLIGRFVEKLCGHYDAGEVTAAIILVNNATETAWFQAMASRASAICFPARRVRFLDPDGAEGAPLQGQAVLYLGFENGAFLNAFRRFGSCAIGYAMVLNKPQEVVSDEVQ